MVENITDNELKRNITDEILHKLPDWFEVEESIQEYIDTADKKYTLAYKDNDKYIGFIAVDDIDDETCEISVMGVLNESHRGGIGTLLVKNVLDYAKEKGFRYIIVKTVEYGKYAEYDITNMFYRKCGFEEYEKLDIWGEDNPCQVYRMKI